MPAYTWGNLLQVLVLFFWFVALLLLSLSTPALDYPAHEAKTDYIANNPAEVVACEAEAVGGDASCVKAFYKVREWRTAEWYMLYFTLPVTLIVTFVTVVYLMFQKHGIFWFVALIAWILGFLWTVAVIIVTMIYWINCSDHTACANARFVYADLLGFGNEVKMHVASWWVVHMVAHYVLFLCYIGMLVFSIATQACLSSSVNGRKYGLDPLFTREDARRLDEANAQIGAGLPDGVLPTEYLTKTQ